MRLVDWHRRQGHDIASGALVPALTDWELTEVPPVNLLYRPRCAASSECGLFIDFVTQLFRDIEQQREHRLPATSAPQWLKTRHPRACGTIARER